MLEHPKRRRARSCGAHADGRWHWQDELDLEPARRPDDRRDHPQRPRRHRTQGARRPARRGVADPRDDRVGRAARSRCSTAAASLTAVYTERALLPDPLARRRHAPTSSPRPDFPPEVFEQVADDRGRRPAAVGSQCGRPRGDVRRLHAAIPTAPSHDLAELGISATLERARSSCRTANAVAGHADAAVRHDDVDRERHRPLVERVVSLAAVAIEQAQAREDLEYRAFHDELTGLPNRALLNDRLTHALAAFAARRHGGRGAVPRPRPLQARQRQPRATTPATGCSRRSRSACVDGLRASDTVGRLGGDEFVVRRRGRRRTTTRSTPRCSGSPRILEQPFEVDCETLFVSASIGVVGRARRRATPPTCCAKPTTRCTAPSNAGRRQRRVPVRTTGRRPRRTALARVTGLHRALERDELVVHYQPIVDIRSRQPVSRSKRSCAGTTPSSASSRPATSSRSPRTPG